MPSKFNGDTAPTPSGSIAWMARNPVAANLLMVIFLLGGAIVLFTQVRQEIFPAFEIDQVMVTVPYPGASPEEVEKGVVLAIEEAVEGLEGVKKVSSEGGEGGAVINIELLIDADKSKTTSDIKNAIDRITTFPEDAEEPNVQLLTTRREVLSLIVYGNQDEYVLRNLAEMIRDDLLKDERITQVELAGVRPLEISIEVPEENLRAYDLTLEEIARQVARTSIEVPGGGVKTPSGEVLLRTTERRELGREFEDLSIISSQEGARVRLGDISKITDGFEDSDVASFFNGQPAVRVNIFRIGDQTPLEVAKAVKQYKAQLDPALPPGIKTAIWADRSEIYYQRIELLRRNAAIGLVLVFGILGLFLETRLAFWVTMGIPISFLGSFLFLPTFDVSINMISLFGFIVTLGMVVDDAIVIGESIYVHRQQNGNFIQASINGAHEVAVPVVFSILTTLTAFSPMFFVTGVMGKVFRILPAVVICVLGLSLFESLYILPAHLGHLGKPKTTGLRGAIYRLQQRISRQVEKFSVNIYGPVVKFAVKYHWITWAMAIFMLIIAVGFVKGGRLKIMLFPKIESDWVVAEATLPYGVSLDETYRTKKRLENATWDAISQLNADRSFSISKGVLTYINGSHKLVVVVFLVPMDQRDISATEFANVWREKIGYIAGLESLTFDSTAGGPHGGKPVHVQLAHRDIGILEDAAEDLAKSLRTFAGVMDIDDGFSTGKPQLNFTIKPEAESLGLTAMDIGRQMRNRFWGAEAIRQQRGRNMIRVVVRLPESQRQSEYNIEELLIRLPNGGEIPLNIAANIERGQSYTTIKRVDGQRIVPVTAEINYGITGSQRIVDALVNSELPKLMDRYPGLSYTFEGAEREGKESVQSLFMGLMIAVLIMYVLVAIPFKSYIQPIAVLSAIPFGFIGASLGHMVMGYSLSLISLMGLLALSGVVVNDSLVLIHTANRYAENGMSPKEAVSTAGIRRFRPIVLTSLTTFLGLTPMIFETSLQARFLIPMAISLGFGVLFSTIIILVMVPAFYIILEDIKEICIEIIHDIGRIIGSVGKIIKS